ncbi:MAG: ATP-binding protein [Planctomycetota bacterium]|nr:ATP-binding protein [Planctomycetota bacterium]
MSKSRLLWHLYLPYLVVTLTAVAAVTWLISGAFHSFHLNQIDNDLEIRARLIEQQVINLILEKKFNNIDEICKSLTDIGDTRITILLPDGKVIADSSHNIDTMENHLTRPEISTALKGQIGTQTRFSQTIGQNMRYVAVPVKNQQQITAIIRTAIPVTDIEQQLAGIYKKLFTGAAIAVIVPGTISLIISGRISRPIERMKTRAKEFASGNFDKKIRVSGCSELVELASDLNVMAEQLHQRINTITKQKNESEAVLSSMVEGVIAIDSEGRLVSINKAAAKFLGIEIEQAYDRSIEELIRQPELQDFMHETLKRENPKEGDIFVSGNDGKYFQVHGTSLSDEKGIQTGAVVVLNDITQMRRLESIRQNFVANVSHELKTPVTSIKGFVETLLDGAINEPQQARRFLEIISKQSERLNAIIEDLLTLSRLEQDQQRSEISLDRAKIKPVLEAAVELSNTKAAEKQISFKLECMPDLESRINSALLEQAVVNLIDNAIKYSDNGKDVRIKGEINDKELLITVEDDGCGIEEKHLSRIFERFYVVDKSRSRKLGGTGLGLSIVKHIVHVHGGSVTVTSELGEGSIFQIHLPFLKADLSNNA